MPCDHKPPSPVMADDREIVEDAKRGSPGPLNGATLAGLPGKSPPSPPGDGSPRNLEAQDEKFAVDAMSTPGLGSR